MVNCTSNGKDTIIHIIAGLIKSTFYKNKSTLSLAVKNF